MLFTTSVFSPDARDYVKKIVLIEGGELAKLMMDHGVGVIEVATYAVRKMDYDYFGDEE